MFQDIFEDASIVVEVQNHIIVLNALKPYNSLSIKSSFLGTRMYSGFGGQVDFIRGAAEGYDGKGKPIVAMQSVTNKGESKIVPTLKIGKFVNENM